MIVYRSAIIVAVNKSRSEMDEVIVDTYDGHRHKAVCYTSLIGTVDVGDNVIVNTTAVELGLGTGGYHFVVWNLDNMGDKEKADFEITIPDIMPEREDAPESEGESLNPLAKRAGHIMKLRYTPMQLKCLSVEEEDSLYHNDLKNVTTINGLPVIIGTLHSQLPAVAVTIKEIMPNAKVVYIMTDGAALPLAFSNIVAELKTSGIIETSITVGHAFGGDLEAINIYSGLVAAKRAAKADIVIVCMGPGIVGTGTKLGYTGIEQGQIINAVNAVEGKAIAIPRISFADKRDRHYGISHHTMTALGLAAISCATITLPEMEKDKSNVVENQIERAGLREKHNVVAINADNTIEAMKRRNILPTTMGRGIDKEPEFFKAAGAAAIYAVGCLND